VVVLVGTLLVVELVVIAHQLWEKTQAVVLVLNHL
jgi:hypothetical protein